MSAAQQLRRQEDLGSAPIPNKRLADLAGTQVKAIRNTDKHFDEFSFVMHSNAKTSHVALRHNCELEGNLDDCFADPSRCRVDAPGHRRWPVAHRRSMRRKPNPRPPHLRPCPDCARRCTTAPLRLASCAPSASTAFLTYVHVCQLQIASLRPRQVCSRADIEPVNEHSDTPTTMPIDGLFFLSVLARSEKPFVLPGAHDGLSARLIEQPDSGGCSSADLRRSVRGMRCLTSV